jgi:hypothetical protein
LLGIKAGNFHSTSPYGNFTWFIAISMPEAKWRNGAVFREIDGGGEVVIFA